jgi:nitrite reductase (NO-forming)
MRTIHLSVILLSFIVFQAFLAACNSVKEEVAIAAVETPNVPTLNTNVEFTLKTITNHGGLAYEGVGGNIDGLVNPDLNVQPGDVVRVILINGDGMPHDLYLPDFDVKSEYVSKIGDQTEIIFEVGDTQPGNYVYYCTVPGHRQAGQEGKLIVAIP